MRVSGFKFFLLSSLTLGSAAVASAGTTTVLATDSVYAVGTNASSAASYGSSAPAAITFASGTSYFTFSVTGAVSVNGGGNVENADGYGSAGYGNFSSVAGLSGINTPDGSLSAVFIGAGGPSGTAPASLSFLSASATQFSSLSPLLDQVFFLGDGLTGNGTGATQTFYVPTGATALYLGIADACSYSGAPSCFGDNSGSYAVSYTAVGGAVTPPSVTPEPSSLVLLGTGALGMAGAARRRFKR